MAEGNRTRFLIAKEASWGVQASTPYQDARYRSGFVRHRKGTVVSETVRSDRQIDSNAEVSASAEGEIGVELAYGADIDMLLEATMYSTVAAFASGSLTLGFTAGVTPTLTRGSGSFVTDGVKAGMWIAVLGNGAANDGYWRVKNVTSATVLDLYEPGITFAGVLIPTVSTQAGNADEKYSFRSLRNGVTPVALTVEEGHLDVNQYMRGLGMRVGQASISIEAEQIGQATFTLEGKQVSGFASTVDGSPTAAPSTTPMTATANVSRIRLNGAAVTSAIRSLQVQIANNLRAISAVGNKYPLGISAGSVAVTGSFEGIFEDRTKLFDPMVNHSIISIETAFVDLDGNLTAITVPRLQLLEGGNQPITINTDVIENYSFGAIRDATDPANSYTIQIDRILKLV